MIRIKQRPVRAITAAIIGATLFALSGSAGRHTTYADVGAAVPTDAPVTIPAVADWQPTAVTFTLRDRARVIVAPHAVRALGDTADTFAADLEALTGRPVRVVVGQQRSARAGDVFMAVRRPDRLPGLDGDLALAQGYRMTVDRVLAIEAATSDGVFAGTRTALQLLGQSTTINGGVAVDAPLTAERAVMVDVARKFYPIEWIYDLVRQMAYLKYNTLHLHLTDDQGFRVGSDTHPEVVSVDHYTKEQMADLIDFAADHHITIIPEIDMPGHMGQILAAYPDLRLVGADGTVKASALDLTKPEAYVLAEELIVEYLDLFPSPVFHLGADEWLSERQIGNFPQLDAYAQATIGAGARGRDVQYAFINWANDIVRAHGKTMRIWNDQLVGGYQVAVDPSVEIDNWYDGAEFGFTPQLLGDTGHGLVNSNWDFLYYIVGITRTDAAVIYERFTPGTFAGGKTLTGAAAEQLRGVQLAVWGDLDPNAETTGQVAYGISKPLRSVAQVTWGSPKPAVDYDGFLRVIDTVGDAPGYATVEEPWADVPVASTSLTAAAGHPVANLADGRLGTSFRSASAPAAGDTVTLDLRAARSVGGINLRAGAADLPGSDARCATLNGSLDGTTWTTLGTVDGTVGDTTEAHLLVPGAPELRYVRLQITCPQDTPIVIAELGVTAQASSATGPTGAVISSSLPTYDVYAIANATDGNPATFYWGGRGARLDDYVALDLGAPTAIQRVDLLMAAPPDRTGDYLRRYVVEVSLDGATWLALGSFADQPEIQVAAPPGTTARYVRVRSTADQGDWTIVRELSVA